MSRSPRVSIGLPVYNGANFVAEAIESLLGQTFADFELVISDNGSNDETPAIIRAFAERDERVRYFREEKNRGVSWNFNRVLELSRGEYFKWAAHDDVNALDQVERLVEILDARPEVVLAGFQTAVIDELGECLSNADGAGAGVDCFDEARLNFEPAWREEKRRKNTASDSPWRRFHGVLLDSQRCYEAFALTRTSVLRETRLYRGYRGCEKVILAEIALRGKFAEAGEVLFFSRWHDSRYSAAANARQQRQHFNPQASQGFVLPFQFRCTYEYLRAIAMAPISFGQKIACGGVMLRFLLQVSKWPGIFGNLLKGRADNARMPKRIEKLGRHPKMPPECEKDSSSLNPGPTAMAIQQRRGVAVGSGLNE